MAVPSKYGLFDFFEEGSLAVGPLHRVDFGGSGVSVNCLNPQDWNPDKEVMVRWGSPGHLYPAKILEISENKHSLIQMREHLIKATGDEICGRGRRKKKRVYYSSSEDESQVIFKKNKTESKGPALTTLEHSREKLTETSDTKCANCLRLQQRVRELEEDKQTLTFQMDIICDMKNMLTELRDSLVRGPACSSPQLQDNPNNNVLIAEGVEVNRVKLHRCNHREPRRLVSDLLGVFFTRREMATHTLTGHKSSSATDVKPALDNILVNAIFDYTLKKFPMADIKDLKKAVKYRLYSESELYKKALEQETRQPDLGGESASSAEGPEGQEAGPFVKEEFVKEEFIKEEDQDADPENPPCHISSVCSKSYAALLRQHKKSHSSRQSKLFPCNICGKRFSKKSNMTRHMHIHRALKKFACGVCDMRFTRQYLMKEHMHVHSGDKPYKCHLCRWGFTLKCGLVTHLRRSHSNATSSAV